MPKQKTLKNLLKNKLKSKHIPRSFDLIGDIAIIEIPKSLVKKEKTIGNTLLNLHENIKTVVKKIRGHEGRLRIQKYLVIAGEKKKKTIHKENKCSFTLQIDKTYFSVRLSNERKRISLLVKPKESILVLFSGIAPYPIVISKHTKAKEIVGIELNKSAHKFALENLKLNKTNNIILYQGDVKKILPKLNQKFNRIVMPLPRGAENYLNLALKKIKNKGIIHFYDFVKEDKLNSSAEKVKSACKKENKSCKIIKTVKCGKQGPGIYRICIDFRVN